MRSFLLCSFLTFFVLNISAQSDFRPGFIITNSLDTLHGFVDYRGEIRNMKVCNFKEHKAAPAREFNPGDIYGYRYNSGKFYITKQIKTEAFSDTVFVEFLLKGISNLFFYRSLNYTAYFIESEKGELLELKAEDIEIEKDGAIYYRESKKYIGLLNYAFSDIPEIRQNIADAELNHKSMIQITRKYHDYKCSDDACIVYEKKIPVLKVELKPLLGFSLSSISFDNSNLEEINFQTSTSPTAGIGMNFIVPRWNEKITFQINLSLNKDYFYGSQSFSTPAIPNNLYYHIHKTSLIACYAFKYTYPTGKIRPQMLLGLYTDLIINQKTSFYSERYVLNTVYTSEGNPDLFNSINKGITAGLGIEYKFLKKLRAFSSLSILYGSNTQNNDLKTIATSLRFSTGLTF